MPLHEVIRAATSRPAEVIGRQDTIGSASGRGRRATSPSWSSSSGEFEFADSSGAKRTVPERLVVSHTIRAGMPVGRAAAAPGAQPVCAAARFGRADRTRVPRERRRRLPMLEPILADHLDLQALEAVEHRVLWLATSIVHHANKVRPRPLGREGRRPPGVVGLDGVDHDGAVVRASARRPIACRSSRTRRRSCTRSSICSASWTRVSDDAARVRRAAELSEPAQGSGAGRLLDRLGRDRRDRPDLERDRAPVRGRALRRAAAAGGRSRCSATPSSTRARSGRRSSTRSCRASARCCGSSTSTASRWTGSCPTSRRAGSRRCSRRLAGRRSPSSTAAGCASCSRATAASALRRRIDEMPNEEYQRLLRSDAGELRERLPGQRPRQPRGRAADRGRSTTRSCCARSATSAGTISRDLLDAFAAGRRGHRPADR